MNSYVGFANDDLIRYRASSGGVGSALVKYLFESHLISHALSFTFDARTLRYAPKLVTSFSAYQITGSIYQDIDLIKFACLQLTREVVGSGRVLMFALPCQTRAIRAIAKRNGIQVIVFGLTCSSQQDFSATTYLIGRLGIKQSDIEKLQYRGNGWPSGIQMGLKDGTFSFVPNNGSLWTLIFHSRFFIPKRCFNCTDTLNSSSDISLADPWLHQYVSAERVGMTLFIVNTELGGQIVGNAIASKAIAAMDIALPEVYRSQQGTIDRKKRYRKNIRWRKFLMWVIGNPIYRFGVLHLGGRAFSVHCKFVNRVESMMKDLQEERCVI